MRTLARKMEGEGHLLHTTQAHIFSLEGCRSTAELPVHRGSTPLGSANPTAHLLWEQRVGDTMAAR